MRAAGRLIVVLALSLPAYAVAQDVTDGGPDAGVPVLPPDAGEEPDPDTDGDDVPGADEVPPPDDEPAPPDAEPAASDLTEDLVVDQPPPPAAFPPEAEQALARLAELERAFVQHALPEVDIPREEFPSIHATRTRALPTGMDALEQLGTSRLVDEVRRRRAHETAEAYALMRRSMRPAAPDYSALKGAPLGPVTWDIPPADNAMVRKWIAFFQGVGQKYYRLWVARYWRYGPTMRRILREQGVPEDMVFLSMIESGFSPRAYSFAHAAGQWQFIRPTGEKMGLAINYWVDERRDPIKATYAAAAYLKELYRSMGHWYLAWASYNAGPGKVRRAMRRNSTSDFFVLAKGRSLRKETRNYVPKLLAAAIIGKDPAAFGFGDIEPLPPFEFDELPLTDNLALDALATACGVTVDELAELNPAIRRNITPPVTDPVVPFVLRVPRGRVEACTTGLDALPVAARTRFRRHVVKPGDTVASVAARFATSEDAVRAQNAMAANARLVPGEDLLVPVPPGPPVIAGDMEDDVKERRGRVVKSAPPRGARAVKVTVRKGDTLWDIASAHKVDVRSVVAWNGLNRRRRLRVGQQLVIFIQEPTRAVTR